MLRPLPIRLFDLENTIVWLVVCCASNISIVVTLIRTSSELRALVDNWVDEQSHWLLSEMSKFIEHNNLMSEDGFLLMTLYRQHQSIHRFMEMNHQRMQFGPDTDVGAIVRALHIWESAFRTLSLTTLVTESTECIVNALYGNKLTTLMVHYDSDDNDDPQHNITRVVDAAISGNTTLTNIDISSNNIPDTSITTLCGLLSNNKTLRCINLSDNIIGDDGLKQLITTTKAISTLTELTVSSNNIGDASASYLTLDYDCWKHIRLDLRYNDISSNGLKTLCKTLCKDGCTIDKAFEMISPQTDCKLVRYIA